jgi:glycosyltransferase involved in cell wall biosynthesis
MRVALAVHCFFPEHFYGTERYTLDVARNLRAMGHDAVVLSAVFAGEAPRSDVVTRYVHEGVPVWCIDKNRFPNTRVQDTYYQPAVRKTLDEVLREIAPDIVHVTHLINHTAVLLEAVEALGVPAVATFTDFFGFCYNNKLETADGSLCGGPNARRTNCVACHLKARSRQADAAPLERALDAGLWCSVAARALDAVHRFPRVRDTPVAGMVADLKQRPAILAARYAKYRAAIAPTRFLRDAYVANDIAVPITDIHFGVDFPRSPKPARPPDAPIRFGFIGQLAPHKGTDILIDAFCRLPPGAAELRIHGPEDQDPDYTARLKARSGPGVSFLGTFPHAQLAEVMAGLDFLVIPSRWYENSPLVLLNALASHTPVVVADVAGMTELVEAGRNGFVFARGSVDALEQVLRAIVERPAEALALTQTTTYPKTTRAMTEETFAVYAKVLRGAGI